MTLITHIPGEDLFDLAKRVVDQHIADVKQDVTIRFPRCGWCNSVVVRGLCDCDTPLADDVNQDRPIRG